MFRISMASQTSKAVGCSRCLIEAIERHDERRLRDLLSANVQYSDTYWANRLKLKDRTVSCKEYIEKVGFDIFQHFPLMLTNRESVACEELCTHREIDATATPGDYKNIAMSVVLAAMLHTTAEFNAFQVLIESHKIDMDKQLMFHMRKSEMCDSWLFVQIDLEAMALLVDTGKDFDDPNSCLVLKTLKRSSLNLEKSLRAIDKFSNKERVLIASGALSFLYNCCSDYYSPFHFFLATNPLPLLRLLKEFSHIGINFNPRIGSCITYLLDSDTMETTHKSALADKGLTLLSALIEMFYSCCSDENEFFVGQCIRFGLIGCASDDPDDAAVLSKFVDRAYKWLSCPDRKQAYDIARQLLALGLLQMGGGLLQFDQCEKCYATSHPEVSYYFVKKEHLQAKCFDVYALSLQREFFEKPLSLLQLSRAAIRRQLGMNDFERRVQTLQLPPLLLEYVWLANEMLADE